MTALKLIIVLIKLGLLFVIAGWALSYYKSGDPIYRQPVIIWFAVILPLLMGYESILSIFKHGKENEGGKTPDPQTSR